MKIPDRSLRVSCSLLELNKENGDMFLLFCVKINLLYNYTECFLSTKEKMASSVSLSWYYVLKCFQRKTKEQYIHISQRRKPQKHSDDIRASESWHGLGSGVPRCPPQLLWQLSDHGHLFSWLASFSVWFRWAENCCLIPFCKYDLLLA